jgi:hypothetical protein
VRRSSSLRVVVGVTVNSVLELGDLRKIGDWGMGLYGKTR